MENMSLFEREDHIAEKFGNIILSGGIDTENDRLILSELLKEYLSLLDQMKKVIKISDRVHGKLNRDLHSTSELSNIDFLTDIFNRRYFNEIMIREWKNCTRDRTPMSVLMIDVDMFKSYNDTYGHQEGDKCLQMIASQLKNLINRPRDVIARYGGEEFIVLLPGTGLPGARNLAETIRSTIENAGQPHSGYKKYGVVTVSIGISSVIPEIKSSPEMLIERADKALYAAKEKGRNAVSE
jgi:diguanylate cyclase (GGDEF)-like protein